MNKNIVMKMIALAPIEVEILFYFSLKIKKIGTDSGISS